MLNKFQTRLENFKSDLINFKSDLKRKMPDLKIAQTFILYAVLFHPSAIICSLGGQVSALALDTHIPTQSQCPSGAVISRDGHDRGLCSGCPFNRELIDR